MHKILQALINVFQQTKEKESSLDLEDFNEKGEEQVYYSYDVDYVKTALEIGGLNERVVELSKEGLEGTQPYYDAGLTPIICINANLTDVKVTSLEALEGKFIQ